MGTNLLQDPKDCLLIHAIIFLKLKGTCFSVITEYLEGLYLTPFVYIVCPAANKITLRMHL